MSNNKQPDSVRIADDQPAEQLESFAVRRARIINAMRRSSRPPAPTIADSAGRGVAAADAGTVVRRRPATTEINLVKSSIPLPRRTPRAQIADDTGAEPTQKHDPREHYTADQVAQVRTSLMELGE